MTPGLVDAVPELLARAQQAYAGSTRASGLLAEQERRWRQPLRVAVAGARGSGKSGLVNAIVGQRVAPLACRDGRCPPAWYTDGQQPHATVRGTDGSTSELPVSRHGGGPPIDLSGHDPERVDHVEVTWPARKLRDLILLDTPAVAGRSDADRVAAQADAVVLLARQPHGSDLRTLWDWQRAGLPEAAGLPVVLVLAHADALSAGRVDALTSSRQLARGYATDERLRGMCVRVLAASAQLAEAGRSATDAEYASLAALAALPKPELDPLLLSSDRLANARLGGAAGARQRQELLSRFGLAGVRLATTLIRQGCGSSAALANELTTRSGLTELRECLRADLVAHRDLLKARSTLAVLDAVLREEPKQQAAPLAARVEQLLAGAHEFRELRLRIALRAGTPVLPEPWREEAGRLLGAYGEDAAGQPLGAALTRWRRRAGNPALTAPQRAAATTVATTCERLATQR